jgi:hypothetical protein
MGKREEQIRRVVGEKAESAVYKISQSHVQPPAKPVYNNRVVFAAGFITGAVITLWVTLFLIKFIPLVLQ